MMKDRAETMAKGKAQQQQPSIVYLIHRIAARLEDSINAKARKYRLRIGEIRVLMRILSHGDLNVGQLASMTSIEPSALSHLLRRLVQEGWVTRAAIEPSILPRNGRRSNPKPPRWPVRNEPNHCRPDD